MTFLLRVELPDVPGSLGRLATALGAAGADIEAIEIVEHRPDGRVVDDVLLELPSSVMPDALITACHALEGVRVNWISRYNAGVNLRMDLEAVEMFTNEPHRAVESLVELLPVTFRVDWAVAVRPNAQEGIVLHASPASPESLPPADTWLTIESAQVLPDIADWESTVMAASPAKDRNGEAFIVVVGRHGGPEFLTSEVARLGHIVSLAASVQIPSAGN